MIPYRIIEHTADTGIKIYGKSLPELFINASRGMFCIITSSANISNNPEIHKKDIIIDNASNSFEILLVEFLNELLYFSNKEKIIFIDFDFSIFTDNIIKGVAKYIYIEKNNIDIIKEIKGVTFHELSIVKNGDIYSSNIYFDV